MIMNWGDAGNLRPVATWATGLLLIGALLFPPWDHTFQARGISQVVKPAGHHLIFMPPEPGCSGGACGASIAGQRLTVIVLAILVIGAMVYISTRHQPKSPNKPTQKKQRKRFWDETLRPNSDQ